jgi:hypothetical protein
VLCAYGLCYDSDWSLASSQRFLAIPGRVGHPSFVFERSGPLGDEGLGPSEKLVPANDLSQRLKALRHPKSNVRSGLSSLGITGFPETINNAGVFIGFFTDSTGKHGIRGASRRLGA